FALAIEMLPEIIGVQLTARQHGASFSSDQSGATQAEENQLIFAGVITNHFPKTVDQLLFVMEAKQLIAQMIAKWTMLGSRVGEQIADCGSTHCSEIQRSTHQIRVATQQRCQTPDLIGFQWRTVTTVKVGNLLGREVLQFDHFANVEGRLIEI